MPSTGKNKMGGHCDATSNEIMTPMTFFANIQDTSKCMSCPILSNSIGLDSIGGLQEKIFNS